MAKIDFNLADRAENIRQPKKQVPVVHFELQDIFDHFNESLKDIDNQSETADILLQEGKDEECQDIWRSQIVFLEGILDFYLHEMSKYALYQMFSGQWNKSKKYFGIKVPMELVENAYEDLSTKEWFFSFLNQEMSKQVYLSAESMKDQLNLIGIPFNDVMSKAFPKSTVNDSLKYGKTIVREMFDRRNKIVHQNDREHTSANRTTISKNLVALYRQQIAAIVNAIQEIAIDK